MHRGHVTFQVVLPVGRVGAHAAREVARGRRRDAGQFPADQLRRFTDDLLLLTTELVRIEITHPRGALQTLEKLLVVHQRPVAPSGEHELG